MTLAEQIDSPPSPADVVATPGADRHGLPMDLPARFRFACFGANFEAIVEDREGGAVLSLHSAIRPLPYAAEDPAARRRLHAVLRAAAKSLPGRLVLSARQQVEFRAAAAIEAPAVPALVLRQATIMLLRWRPLFEIVRRQA